MKIKSGTYLRLPRPATYEDEKSGREETSRSKANLEIAVDDVSSVEGDETENLPGQASPTTTRAPLLL
jgi:hypothetical protein